MSSLPKGESMGTKLFELFANWVVRRRNMINDYLRGRAYIKSVRGSLILREFWVFRFWAFLCLFSWFAAFRAFCWLLRVFSSRWHSWAFFSFWPSSCASWGLVFELQIVCLLLSMDSSRGRLRNQVISYLVWLWWVIDLTRFEFESGTFRLFYIYPCFIWRITFACLTVCMWQVQHGGQWWGSWQE
jgi:hypothetical protein